MFRYTDVIPVFNELSSVMYYNTQTHIQTINLNLNLMDVVFYNLQYIMFILLITMFSVSLIIIFRQIMILISSVNTFQFISYYDFSNIILIYISLIVVLFLGNITNLYLLKLNVLGMVSIIFLKPVLILPCLYLLTFSTNSLLCLGLIQKKSILGGFVNDCITLISFLLRFSSQYIRIILIVFVFILFYEYINSLNFSLTKTNLWLVKTTLTDIIFICIRIFFEICDGFFILIIQFNTFFIILLWLLSFLFVLKFNNIFEN